MKDKQYYIDRYNAFFDNVNCNSEEANSLFEDTANAEEIAGYYLVVYEDKAYRQWTENLYRTRCYHRTEETEQDQQITKILKEMCGIC